MTKKVKVKVNEKKTDSNKSSVFFVDNFKFNKIKKDFLQIDFGKEAENNTVRLQTSVSFNIELLMPLIVHLLQAGVIYQEKYGVDLGLKLNDEEDEKNESNE